MYVSLDEAKEYLGIYYDEKNAEVALFVDAAEAHVANFLGHALTEELLDNSGDSQPDLDRELKPNVKLAILMHVAGWFENRQVNQEAPLNSNPEALTILHFERDGLGV